MVMGPLYQTHPPLTLSHLLLATFTGGLLCHCLFCNGATLPNPTKNTPGNPHSLTPAPEGLQPIPDSNATAVQPAPERNTTALPPTDAPLGPQGPLNLEQPPKEKAVEGEDVVFSCLLKGGGGGAGEVEEVRWELQGPGERHAVLEGNRTSGDTFISRAFLSGDPSTGDFSMTLRNISAADRGVYLCLLTLQNGTNLQGGGTKLSIRKDQGLVEESIGTMVGVVVAAVGVVAGLIAVTLTQFKEKLNCVQR